MHSCVCIFCSFRFICVIYILCDGLDVSYAELSPQVRHEEKGGYILLIESLEAMEQC